MTHTADDPDKTIWAEFSAWRDTMPQVQAGVDPSARWVHVFPSPADSLPDGWTHHALLEEYGAGQDMHLVRRGAGGWMLLTHARATRHVEMFDTASTLAGLHEQVRDLREELVRDRVAITSVARMVIWLAGELSSRYDPAIEIEAAAQVILALGGRAVVEPRAAHAPQRP